MIVHLRQCLNSACDKTNYVSLDDGLRLEPTLWDRRSKAGKVVLRDAYRKPDAVFFGDFRFDDFTFSPTRDMARVYDVDRMTFWPRLKSPYVARTGLNEYTLSLPRRKNTLLLEISGLPARKIQGKISVVREFWGINFDFFGLLGRPGHFVRWNNREYLVFLKVKPGVFYSLKLDDDNYRFEKSGRNVSRGHLWNDCYQPLSLNIVPRE